MGWKAFYFWAAGEGTGSMDILIWESTLQHKDVVSEVLIFQCRPVHPYRKPCEVKCVLKSTWRQKVKQKKKSSSFSGPAVWNQRIKFADMQDSVASSSQGNQTSKWKWFLLIVLTEQLSCCRELAFHYKRTSEALRIVVKPCVRWVAPVETLITGWIHAKF